MSNIFYGFIFIFLNFTINIDVISLGLIPDFVGYIFIVNGLNELKAESDFFAKAKPWAIAMAVYTAIEYVMSMVGLMSLLKVVGMIFGLICFVIDVYIIAMIINGLREMEKNDYADYEVERLKNIWIVDVLIEGVATFVACIAIFMARLEPVGNMVSGIVVFEIPLVITSLVVSIIFLVRYNRTRKAVEFAKPLIEAKKRQESYMQ